MFFYDYLKSDSLKLEAVVAYLTKGGWYIDKTFPNKKLLVFKKKYDNEVITLSLPASENFSDYHRRLVDLIADVADIEDISRGQVIQEVKALEILISKEEKILKLPKGAKDRLSFRIISEESKDGSIPLAYSDSIMSGIKKLILSAIYSERNKPLPVFESNLKSLYAELGQYKMAQTDIGSFIINIDISLDDQEFNQLGLDLGYDDSFSITNSRKIIRRIQNGITAVCQSSNSPETFNYLSEHGYETGLNANMCDAILEFKNISSDVEIETKVEWSEELPPPTGITEKVKITSNDFIVFETLSKKYKEQEVTEIEATGFIIQLYNSFSDSDTTISKRPKRYVIIAAQVKNSLEKIRIYLDENDYATACLAHSNHEMVSVTGIVDKKSRYLAITKYSNFKKV